MCQHGKQECVGNIIEVCKCRRFQGHISFIRKNVHEHTCRADDIFQQMDWLVGWMVFNSTFNNISVISWGSVLLVKETGVLGENHRPVASHWETLSHNIVHLALISGDRHWLHRNSCKSNYHTITATPASGWKPFLQKSVAQLRLETIQKLKSCIFLCFFFVFLRICNLWM